MRNPASSAPDSTSRSLCCQNGYLNQPIALPFSLPGQGPLHLHPLPLQPGIQRTAACTAFHLRSSCGAQIQALLSLLSSLTGTDIHFPMCSPGIHRGVCARQCSIGTSMLVTQFGFASSAELGEFVSR